VVHSVVFGAAATSPCSRLGWPFSHRARTRALMSRGRISLPDPAELSFYRSESVQLSCRMRSAGTALLFGLRLWASVCLASAWVFHLQRPAPVDGEGQIQGTQPS
jgi:hypothetical protein